MSHKEQQKTNDNFIYQPNNGQRGYQPTKSISSTPPNKGSNVQPSSNKGSNAQPSQGKKSK